MNSEAFNLSKMDILALLPDTHAGQHTKWLWSWMLGIAGDSPPPNSEELAQHFAPSLLDQVPADQFIAQWARLAPTMSLVTQMVEESSSGHRYSALLGFPDVWLRYSCLAEDDEPHLLIDASCLFALDPNSYSDQRVQRNGRDVQIRDFGGSGPLMLLWHGAESDLTSWEALVPFLADFHVVAQDLPGHGRSRLKLFTTGDAMADTDAVIGHLDMGPPAIVGHSLGGYLGLRYAATRRCTGWIGLDGPFGLVYPWDLNDDSELSETVLHIGREISAIDVVKDIAAVYCPAMLLLCAAAANLWDLRGQDATTSPVVLSGHDVPVRTIVTSPDGRWLASGGLEGKKVILWDLQAKDPVSSRIVLPVPEEGGVFTLAISPDNKWLVAGCLDNHARVWELSENGPSETPLALGSNTAPITLATWSPNSRWLATGADDGSLRLWDFSADDLQTSAKILPGHVREILSGTFSHDSRWLVTGARSDSAHIWDVSADAPGSTAVVLRSQADGRYVALTPNSKWLITAGIQHTQLWDFSIESLLSRARRAAGRGLTEDEKRKYAIKEYSR